MSAAVSRLALQNGQERQQTDAALGRLISAFGENVDAEYVLHYQVFMMNSYDLHHVERLLEIATTLEAYVRARRAWRGK